MNEWGEPKNIGQILKTYGSKAFTSSNGNKKLIVFAVGSDSWTKIHTESNFKHMPHAPMISKEWLCNLRYHHELYKSVKKKFKKMRLR